MYDSLTEINGSENNTFANVNECNTTHDGINVTNRFLNSFYYATNSDIDIRTTDSSIEHESVTNMNSTTIIPCTIVVEPSDTPPPTPMLKFLLIIIINVDFTQAQEGDTTHGIYICCRT